MRVYEAIVKGLGSVGVEAAFGGAGENAAGLMLALHEAPNMRTIITKHEQAASFMACGYAMYTDRLGVCFATAGPGAFNLFSGLATALSDSYPVLAISGYSSVHWRGKGALNETSGAARTPDSLKMFEACSKRAFFLENPADTCDVVEEAVNTAFEGRPGPVHITVPANLADPEVSVDNYRDLRLRYQPVTPDPAEVAAAAGFLMEALRARRRVLILAGFGAVRSRAGDALRTLAERFQIPVATTLDGKGILPERHPLVVGVFSDSGHKEAWRAFVEAEIVLAVGNSFAQHATFDFRDDLLDGKRLVHVNIARTEIDKVYKADRAIVGDARLAIEALLEVMPASADAVSDWRPGGYDFDGDRILHITGQIHPGQLSQAISRLLPENGVVLADAGAHAAWLGYYLGLREGQNFRKPGGFGPMAGHTNGALGLKLACPERTVVVGCGDGCYLLSGFELMSAVEHDLPVIWVIFNDGEFKLIKLYQLFAFRDHALTHFTNPDYAAYARACGAEGYRVESLDAFEAAFRTALASRRPTVIDAAITRRALPNYSPSPEGLLAGVMELVRERLDS